jgi:tetratricopeptide (TPR) repeat protein
LLTDAAYIYSAGMNAPPQVMELERRIRWPGWPTLLFLGFMAMFLVMIGSSLVMRPPRPRGLPEDAGLRVAAGLPDPSLAVIASELRFRAAAFDGAPAVGANDAATLARARESERTLARWAGAHRREPRVRAALGALALVRHDYAAAETRYREACERAPHYGEGRLGWGVALALEGSRTSDAWQRRALMLRAIAQFAAVDATEPEYPLALYNRAWLLAEVGRAVEARTFADRYVALEPAGAWADRLRGAAVAR